VLREFLGGRRRRFFALLENRIVGFGITQRFHYFAIQRRMMSFGVFAGATNAYQFVASYPG